MDNQVKELIIQQNSILQTLSEVLGKFQLVFVASIIFFMIAFLVAMYILYKHMENQSRIANSFDSLERSIKKSQERQDEVIKQTTFQTSSILMALERIENKS